MVRLHQDRDIRYNQFTMLSALGVVLNNECHLHQAQAVLVGFSGGPDSLMLIHAMHMLGYPLIAAHLDHGLRPTSAGESVLVQQVLADWHIPFIVTRRDVKAFAAERGLSIEEAARVVRYEFLFDLAKVHQTQAVVVGHQADDQVETVLMHMLRGSGLAGLCGMSFYTLPNPWSDAIPLVRPLLGVWRKDILAYCHENDLHPLEDPSNRDPLFFRNRLRNELIPFLEANYNPSLRKLVQHMADNLSQDYGMITSLVDQAWQACLTDRGCGYLTFSSEKWIGQCAAIQRHLLRRAAYTLLPTLRDIDYETILRVLTFIDEHDNHPSKKPASQIELPGGLRFIYENQYRRIWLVDPSQAHVERGTLPIPVNARAVPQIIGDQDIPLNIPGKTCVAGWTMNAEWVEGERAQNVALKNADPWQAWFDFSLLPEDPQRFSLRKRRSGDRFQPFGMDGKSTKIKEMMIDLKIPRYVRANYPILTADELPIWLPGYRIAHTVSVNPSTRRALYLHFTPPE